MHLRIWRMYILSHNMWNSHSNNSRVVREMINIFMRCVWDVYGLYCKCPINAAFSWIGFLPKAIYLLKLIPSLIWTCIIIFLYKKQKIYCVIIVVNIENRWPSQIASKKVRKVSWLCLPKSTRTATSLGLKKGALYIFTFT